MFGYCSGMGVAGWLVMIGVWVSFLALVIWAVTRLFPSERRSDADALLDQRFAAGEIDADSYRQARQHLAGARRG